MFNSNFKDYKIVKLSEQVEISKKVDDQDIPKLEVTTFFFEENLRSIRLFSVDVDKSSKILKAVKFCAPTAHCFEHKKSALVKEKIS